jgi:hypothetical protein
MDKSTATMLVVAFLSLKAVCVSVASILILNGGKFYHKIPAESRPRRWLVATFFHSLLCFGLGSRLGSIYPRSIISRVLGILFAAATALIAF